MYIYIYIYMRFLQVSYVKCSTGKGSYYRPSETILLQLQPFRYLVPPSDQVNKINSNNSNCLNCYYLFC